MAVTVSCPGASPWQRSSPPPLPTGKPDGLATPSRPSVRTAKTGPVPHERSLDRRACLRLELCTASPVGRTRAEQLVVRVLFQLMVDVTGL